MKNKLLPLALLLAAANVFAQADETWTSWSNDWVRWDGGAPIAISSYYQTIKDETTALAQQPTLTFLGSPITCVNNAGNAATECTITGSGYATIQDEGTPLAQETVIDCQGAGIVCSAGSGKTIITVGAAAGAVSLQGTSPGSVDTGNWNISGVGTSTHNNIHATLTPGLFLSNTQAALVGEQREYSPSLKFCGAGWNVGGAASETDCWQMFNRPTAGTPTTTDLVFQASIAGGAYSQTAYLQSNGHLTLGLSGTTVGALSLSNATSGSILLQPTTGALGGSTYTFPIGSGTVAVLENPSFSLFTVGNGATGPGSFDVLEDSDNGSNYIRVIGQSALAANRTYTLPNIGGDGVVEVSPTAYPGLGRNPLTFVMAFDDMFWKNAGSVGSTALAIGPGYMVGTGTSSGSTATTIVSDGLHPGVQTLTTGTTTTGASNYLLGNANNNNTDSIRIDGGEIYESMIWVPTASDGTNTHKIRAGFYDLATGDGQDQLYIYWDNNADTHWGCAAKKAGVGVATLSTTVATAGAWHKLRVVANSTTSIGYFVDGSELSCSPITDTSKIPVGANEGLFAGTGIVASAGCASATTCTLGIDYVYLYDPLASAR